MKLHGTPLSHFTRKIRILLDELEVPFEMVWTPGVLADGAAAYGDNPLMRIPTLVDGATTIVDSDHIARYLVGRFDPDDRFGVRSERVADLNRLAVTSGVMANEVVLILARRGGLEDLDGVAYFRKLFAAIASGLAWLDQHVREEPELDYRDIALIAMWQHLVHYKLVDLSAYSQIAERVARFAERPSIASTRPS
jgi:glutathione S-transferase